MNQYQSFDFDLSNAAYLAETDPVFGGPAPLVGVDVIGGTGMDAIGLNVPSVGAVGYYSDTVGGPNSGNVRIGTSLALSFEDLAPIDAVRRSAFGERSSASSCCSPVQASEQEGSAWISGANRVHPDAIWPQLHGEGFGHSDDGPFGGGIGGTERITHDPGGGRRHDNEPAALLLHQFRRPATGEE